MVDKEGRRYQIAHQDGERTIDIDSVPVWSFGNSYVSKDGGRMQLFTHIATGQAFEHEPGNVADIVHDLEPLLVPPAPPIECSLPWTAKMKEKLEDYI